MEEYILVETEIIDFTLLRTGVKELMLELNGHGVEYCNQCGITVVICKNCGNNTCNGGYGRLKDGTECPDCKEAYEIFLNKEFDHANSA